MEQKNSIQIEYLKEIEKIEKEYMPSLKLYGVLQKAKNVIVFRLFIMFLLFLLFAITFAPEINSISFTDNIYKLLRR